MPYYIVTEDRKVWARMTARVFVPPEIFVTGTPDEIETFCIEQMRRLDFEQMKNIETVCPADDYSEYKVQPCGM